MTTEYHFPNRANYSNTPIHNKHKTKEGLPHFERILKLLLKVLPMQLKLFNVRQLYVRMQPGFT